MTDAGAGVGLRDQQVTLDITPADAVRANRTQRTRLLASLRELDADDWARSSRCDRWSVKDVVRPLVHMNGLQRETLAAARNDERYTGFKTFDPKATPDEWVSAERS